MNKEKKMNMKYEEELLKKKMKQKENERIFT